MFKKALLLMAILLMQSQVAFAQFEAFDIKPLEPNSVSPSWIVAELKPGTSITEKLVVINKSSENIQFTFYATDAGTTDKGSFTVLPADREQHSIGLWTSLDKSATTLIPMGQEVINMTITVPEDTEYGEYQGGVSAEMIGEKDGTVVPHFRKVAPIKIKVTEDPQSILKLKDIQNNNFNVTILYYVTMVIFLGCVTYLIIAYAINRRKKKNDKKS